MKVTRYRAGVASALAAGSLLAGGLLLGGSIASAQTPPAPTPPGQSQPAPGENPARPQMPGQRHAECEHDDAGATGMHGGGRRGGDAESQPEAGGVSLRGGKGSARGAALRQ
jgi:hypothetical protein